MKFNNMICISIKFFIFCLGAQMNLFAKAQNFGDCDFYKELKIGVVYSFTSPNYKDRYDPGTLCRYTVQAPSGNQVFLSCSEVRMPYSDRCAGDRLSVSRAGNANLMDSERYCNGPFQTKSFSQRLVVALLSPPQSTGGTFRCELYAVKGCDCGRRKQSRIVGGTEADVNEFPSMAAIVKKSSGQVHCGATIIDENYALTAAHCVNARGSYASDIELLVGEHDYLTSSETPYAKKYPIAAAERHAGYSSEKDINDIAILTMRKPIQFNLGVGPVCLPFKFRTANFEGRRVEALGWGTVEYGGPVSSRLLKVSLDVVNQTKCESSYPNSVTSAQICTYSRNKDTCSYDSGGPLLYSDSNLLYQIGITSYGLNCATQAPSVSTKVTAYLDWIISEARLARFCIQ